MIAVKGTKPALTNVENGGSYDDQVRARLKTERQQAYEERVTGRAGGTPETMAKASVTKHASEMLMDRDVIDGGQFANLLAIEAGWRLITEPVTPKMSSLVRSDPGERSEGDWERTIARRYLDWSHALLMRHRLMEIRVCLFVAVDGMTLADIAARIRRREETARELLLGGLDMYRAVKRQAR